MGLWVAILVVLFVIGSIMALKPSGVEQRVDKVRMTARKLELNPKLIACPDWIRGKNNEFGKGMMAQYGIIIDNMKVPHVRYQPLEIDNQKEWRPVQIETSQPTDFSLDHVILDLPLSILDFIEGLEAKANSINIYWNDVAYVRITDNPKFELGNIESDLIVMKEKLNQWADAINLQSDIA